MMEQLQKREDEQMLRQTQVRERKLLKEQKRLRRREKAELLRSLRELKSTIMEKERKFLDQIKDLRKQLKNTKNKDDEACLRIKILYLDSQVLKINEKLLAHGKDSAPLRLNIKEEKLE
ncbi:hypothetical protein QAD02_007197 [Eretmocerus hayati]|uniref:Uncharacterized protein n=1 Tax=Eretmocerus hayati TaxID=131215 RepID=A0ACC2N7A6_9HYME|nr:hypothetical protein QAD02_007197 [Eretmocerus hayati]